MHLAGYPPRVKTLCRKLDIDFAEALVGFERRGGATIPAFDGVVVCAEHATAVRRAFAAEEQCAALFLFVLRRLRALQCFLSFQLACAWLQGLKYSYCMLRSVCGTQFCSTECDFSLCSKRLFSLGRREKAAKAEAKWRAAAQADWRKLLSTVLARMRVEAEHGAMPEPAGRAGSAEDPIALDSDEEEGGGGGVGAPCAPGGRGAAVKVEQI